MFTVIRQYPGGRGGTRRGQAPLHIEARQRLSRKATYHTDQNIWLISVEGFVTRGDLEPCYRVISEVKPRQRQNAQCVGSVGAPQWPTEQ